MHGTCGPLRPNLEVRTNGVAVQVPTQGAWDSERRFVTDAGRSTVVEANGRWVVPALAAPIAIALLPLLAPSRRRRPVGHGAAAAMTLFALVTGFTIGTPYLLPAALMWIASSGPSARPGTATV